MYVDTYGKTGSACKARQEAHRRMAEEASYVQVEGAELLPAWMSMPPAEAEVAPARPRRMSMPSMATAKLNHLARDHANDEELARAHEAEAMSTAAAAAERLFYFQTASLAADEMEAAAAKAQRAASEHELAAAVALGRRQAYRRMREEHEEAGRAETEQQGVGAPPSMPPLKRRGSIDDHSSSDTTSPRDLKPTSPRDFARRASLGGPRLLERERSSAAAA